MPPDERLFYLLPELVPVLNAWFALQTQWRLSDGLPTGLDYAGVSAALALREDKRARRRELFADLQVMERAALDAWAEKRAREMPRQQRRPY